VELPNQLTSPAQAAAPTTVAKSWPSNPPNNLPLSDKLVEIKTIRSDGFIDLCPDALRIRAFFVVFSFPRLFITPLNG
jgi:hypothetical protein